VEEIKSHSFFQNDQWTFDNLRDCKYYLQFSKTLFMHADYVGNNQNSQIIEKLVKYTVNIKF